MKNMVTTQQQHGTQMTQMNRMNADNSKEKIMFNHKKSALSAFYILIAE